AELAQIHALGLEDIELFERALGTAVVRSVGEDRQACPNMGLADRAEHLTLVRTHFVRRADFPERSPSLRSRITHELVRDFILAHLGYLGRIRRLKVIQVFEV